MYSSDVAELVELFAQYLQTEIAGEQVLVRALELREIVALWSNDGLVSDTDNPAAELVVGSRLLALSVMKPGRDWIESLGDDDLAKLFDLVNRANRALFAPPPPTHAEPGARQPTWSDAIAQLVEAGHSLAAIERYTMNQIDLLAAAHARLAIERKLDEVTLARAAQADKKGFREVLSGLKKALARLW